MPPADYEAWIMRPAIGIALQGFYGVNTAELDSNRLKGCPCRNCYWNEKVILNTPT